jgi:thiol-disulfide isomerase/thioredoxin
MKKTLAIIFAILVLATCFAACGGTQNDDTSTTTPGIEGIKIPEENLDGVEYGSFAKFTAVDLAGKKVTEDIFKGKKLTMINIWATFCNPCIREMPDIEALSKEYADEDFQVIGIVCDVNYSGVGYNSSLYQSALDIVEMTGVTYRNLLPSNSLDLIKLKEIYSVPETIFVDENGNIVGTNYIGSKSLENWKAIVDSILTSM